MCKIGDIVVVGGVRRSALLSLSNPSDDRMRNAKSGQWWEQNPHYALANNSVAWTEKPDMERFLDEWISLIKSKSGERGIFNREAAKNKVGSLGKRDPDHEFGLNPCGEIILRDCQFCNLTQVTVRPDDDFSTLIDKVRIATILGTVQASFTKFRYLSKKWQRNCEEEALLGVGFTGIMDNPLMNGMQGESELAGTLHALRHCVTDINAAVC
jgi:ribonucleoside-triphosphate reductase